MTEPSQCLWLVISSLEFIGFCSGVALHVLMLIWSAGLLFQATIGAALPEHDKGPTR